MDAFFASVEQRDDSALRGKPVVVGGSPHSRGVVCTASYEARAYGVRSAMPCAYAARLCPNLVFVKPNFEKYQQASREMHEMFKEVSDVIEPLSLDEAYLDVSANKAGLASATATAKSIRKRVKAEIGLTISAGVSCNKLIAKLASDENKPDGLCVIPPHKIKAFLAGRPLAHLPGVGPKTQSRLENLSLNTVDDLLAATPELLHLAFGHQSQRFLAYANGKDERPVKPAGRSKQISVERTFSEDLESAELISSKLEELSQSCWERLVKSQRQARTVNLKVKLSDFTIVSRSETVVGWVLDADHLFEICERLFAKLSANKRSLRLLGVGVSNWVN
jgi:DNA polymerase-4